MSAARSQPLLRPPSVPLWEDVKAMLTLASQHKDTRREPLSHQRS
jgi:hypothetical protein